MTPCTTRQQLSTYGCTRHCSRTRCTSPGGTWAAKALPRKCPRRHIPRPTFYKMMSLPGFAIPPPLVAGGCVIGESHTPSISFDTCVDTAPDCCCTLSGQRGGGRIAFFFCSKKKGKTCLRIKFCDSFAIATIHVLLNPTSLQYTLCWLLFIFPHRCGSSI